jgi:phosphoribosylanthranilate isomerase
VTAAAALKPWAVNSLTHTNKNLDDGTLCKDLEGAESFVKAANGV